MNQTYIIGSAVISALGKNKAHAVRRMKSLNNHCYSEYRNSVFTHHPFYVIADQLSKKTRFYEMIKKVIFDALDDAKIMPQDYSELTVFIGSTSMDISVAEEEWDEYGCHFDIGNGAIARYIDTLLEPMYPTTIFSTACTSSANALIFASDEIKAGHIKKALVLGIEFFNDATYKGFKSLMLLSESAIYRPLSSQSDGMILGEGCAATVLSCTPNENSDFRILGSMNLFDSYSETSSNPDGKMIYKSIVSALNNSGLSLHNLTLINIHSPGTELSNEAEHNALRCLFEDKIKVPLSSMKPYIGHTLGACSLNEMVLLTSAIKHGFIPETLGVTDTEILTYTSYRKIAEKTVNILFTYNGFGGNNIAFVISNKG